jgi:hypothetical protein
MGGEVEVVVVVDDGCEHDILLVNMVAHNKIHHNTSVVDTIVVVVVVVEVYDCELLCIGRRFCFPV